MSVVLPLVRSLVQPMARALIHGVGAPPAGYAWLTDFEGHVLTDFEGNRLYGAI